MTIQDFTNLVQKHQKEKFSIEYSKNPIEFWEKYYTVTIKPGRKYTKVDIGRSGKYMVVNSTGEIYGIKAYGVINKGHYYGTLETINDWNWGEYSAYKI